MRVVLFCHSLRSCWNHGNAHFLRGVVTELLARGHEVRVYEPDLEEGWSIGNLIRDHGHAPLVEFARTFPQLQSSTYRQTPGDSLDLDRALDSADLVIVHEWSDHDLVARIGKHRARARSYKLLFHDTHHRSVTAPQDMAAYDLRHYDGVLAFGQVIRQLYLERGWAERAYTWHEAADVRVFRPRPEEPKEGDLVWIGNWGDDERTAELQEFLFEPVRELGLRARIHGVRYPDSALAMLAHCGIEYGGWLANHHAPRVLARHRVTVHVPRRPYATALPGIPTIRPFEALACGIPLVCSPWDDSEGLFTPGEDFLVARNGQEMRAHLRAILEDEELARTLAARGLRSILARHTCGHRVDELIAICADLGVHGARQHGTAAEPQGTAAEPQREAIIQRRRESA